MMGFREVGVIKRRGAKRGRRARRTVGERPGRQLGNVMGCYGYGYEFMVRRPVQICIRRGRGDQDLRNKDR
jgi:hypothetical protein